jgi:hypothetical protein
VSGVKWSLSPAIPDLKVPRWEPCSARVDVIMLCGATPSAQYHRECGVVAHAADIWLCPIHAAIVATGGGICKLCADNGGVVMVSIARMTEPLSCQ